MHRIRHGTRVAIYRKFRTERVFAGSDDVIAPNARRRWSASWRFPLVELVSLIPLDLSRASLDLLPLEKRERDCEINRAELSPGTRFPRANLLRAETAATRESRGAAQKSSPAKRCFRGFLLLTRFAHEPYNDLRILFYSILYYFIQSYSARMIVRVIEGSISIDEMKRWQKHALAGRISICFEGKQ